MSVYDIAGRPKISYSPQTQQVLKGATWNAQIPLVAPGADAFVSCPIAGTIRSVTIFTQGGPGSCQIDVRKCAFGSFPPTGANSIVASDPPEITTGTDYNDTVLTGWTTAISAGDVLGFHLTSVSEFTSVTVQLGVDQ